MDAANELVQLSKTNSASASRRSTRSGGRCSISLPGSEIRGNDQEGRNGNPRRQSLRASRQDLFNSVDFSDYTQGSDNIEGVKRITLTLDNTTTDLGIHFMSKDENGAALDYLIICSVDSDGVADKNGLKAGKPHVVIRGTHCIVHYHV